MTQSKVSSWPSKLRLRDWNSPWQTRNCYIATHWAMSHPDDTVSAILLPAHVATKVGKTNQNYGKTENYEYWRNNRRKNMAQHIARDRIAPRMAHSFSEYLEKGCEISVVGRPTERLTYMKSLGFTDFILQTLQMGYLIPFNTAPSRTRLPNNASAWKHMNFVQSAIDDLLLAGAVHECAEPCD